MKKSILIIDDSEADRYITKRYTEKSQLFEQVYSLNDGEEAYNYFKNEEYSNEKKGGLLPPLVIILDINMPKMNGFEFLEKFNQLPKSKNENILFVAMLTSSENESDKEKARHYPCIEIFLTKPFKKEYVELLAQKANEKMSAPNE